MREGKFLALRASPETKERVRRLQGKLQMTLGRRVTVAEAVEHAIASVTADMPVSRSSSSRAKPGDLFVLDESGSNKPAA